MKKLISLLCFTSFSLLNAASNSSGPDSPISVGVIQSISEDQKEITVLQGGDITRTLKLDNPSAIKYISIPNSQQNLTIGYGLKAKVSNNMIKSGLVTLPAQPYEDLGKEKTNWDLATILNKSDSDGDGKLSYVEMSHRIYHSPKHGPDKFSKYDKDKDGQLNLDELTELIKEVSWWKFSRMSADDWFKQADKNQDQALSLDEYKTISNSKSHYENHFKRYDQDKNGSLNQEELSKSLSGESKKKRKKK